MSPHSPRPPRGWLFDAFRRRWADAEPPSDWPWGRFGRRWGGFGPHERLFARGDLKLVILELLKDQPRHGYDVIRALEERFRGFYRPSPGSVYPTLQLLEDLGYVTPSQQEGKKVYAITDQGRRFLDAQQHAVEDIRSRLTAGFGFGPQPETGELMRELRELARSLFRQATRGAMHDPEKLRRLRAVVARARAEIDALSQEQPAPTTVI